jgi:hypothetical protein
VENNNIRKVWRNCEKNNVKKNVEKNIVGKVWKSCEKSRVKKIAWKNSRKNVKNFE